MAKTVADKTDKTVLSGFYPYILRTSPPRVVESKAEIDEYFRKRGTVVVSWYIPATNPRDERGAQSGPNLA